MWRVRYLLQYAVTDLLAAAVFIIPLQKRKADRSLHSFRSLSDGGAFDRRFSRRDRADL